MRQKPQPSKLVTLGGGMQMLSFIMLAAAAPVQVMLHSRPGQRFFGVQAFLAIPLTLLFAGVNGGRDAGPLLLFVIAYVAMCLLKRIGILRRRLSGEPMGHSRYDGRPYLWRLMPKRSELAVKRIEAVLVLATGLVLLAITQPLGVYLVVAAIALLATLAMSSAWERRQALDINDAAISQQFVAERFHEARGETVDH